MLEWREPETPEEQAALDNFCAVTNLAKAFFTPACSEHGRKVVAIACLD